jgi:predicted nucleic acid-binding protein
MNFQRERYGSGTQSSYITKLFHDLIPALFSLRCATATNSFNCCTPITPPDSSKACAMLGQEPLAVGDLILTEVLQGFPDEMVFNEVRRLLTSLTVVELGGQGIAIQAARNFRALRNLGVTVRKTIDTIIATRCLASRYVLLHNDRDFQPFVDHLGLRVAV